MQKYSEWSYAILENNENAQEFYNGLSAFTGKSFRFPDELKSVIFLSFRLKNVEELHQASFIAKYITGLKRVVQNAAGNPEVNNVEDIKKDLMQNFEKLISTLQDIVKDDGAVRELFASRFLEMNPDAFMNLNGFIEDLALLKVYFNSLKRIEE